MAKKNYETGKVITKHLNVREKPDGMVRDLLHLGDCVVVVSKRGEWFKVKGDTVSGWVVGKYLEVKEVE